MSFMFTYCSGLTELDLSSFDTSKVTLMNNMFAECSGLTELDLSGFDTAKVTDMSDMFGYCSGLTSLDLSSFDTSKVELMNSMFGRCSGLTSLDLSSFDTANVTQMDSMFDGCTSLTELDLSSFETSSATDMGDLFIGADNLDTLTLGKNFAAVTEDMRLRQTDGGWFVQGSYSEPVGGSGDYAVIAAPENQMTYKKYGYCGSTAYWRYEEDTRTLYIFGSGDMEDYNNHAPWAEKAIETAVIENGITVIGKNAFADCTGLSSVTLPDSLEAIADSAFAGCTGLSNITLPDSLEVIGDCAFAGCTGLSSIEIPAGVSTFGFSSGSTYNVFEGCSSLAKINVAADNTVYMSKDGILFNKTGDILIYCPEGRTGSYTVPDGVKEIGTFAFRHSGLTDITLPDGLEIISSLAFSGSAIKKLDIPDTVTHIGQSILNGISDAEVIVPVSFQPSGTGLRALNGTTNLTVNYVGTEAQWDALKLDLSCAENLKVVNCDYREEADLDLAVSQPENQKYTGEAQKPEITVALDGKTVDPIYYTVSYEDNVDVGTAKATVEISTALVGRYACAIEKPFQITPADSISVAPVARELTYNGKAQALVVQGSSEHGTMLYSLDGETYSKELPKGTDADLYTVYFYVKGDKNHNDTAVDYFYVRIKQAELKITADPQTKTYGDPDPELTYTAEGLMSGDKITGSPERMEGENRGMQYITQGTLSAGSNYDIDFTDNFLEITPKEVTLKWSGGPFVYDGTEKHVTAEIIGLADGDDVTLEYNDQSYGKNNTGYSIYSFPYHAEATLSGPDAGNYTLNDDGYDWEIRPAQMNAEVSGYEGVYDGKAHGITVLPEPEDAVVLYGTDYSEEKMGGVQPLNEKITMYLYGHGTSECPTFTDAGDYKVYYAVQKDHYDYFADSEHIKIHCERPEQRLRQGAEQADLRAGRRDCGGR